MNMSEGVNLVSFGTPLRERTVDAPRISAELAEPDEDTTATVERAEPVGGDWMLRTEKQVVREDPATPLPDNLDAWASYASAAELPKTEPLSIVTTNDQTPLSPSIWKTLVTPPSGGREGLILHLTSESNVLSWDAFTNLDLPAGIVQQTLLRVPGSDLVVALRGLLDRTLADDLSRLDSESLSEASLARRIEVLRRVLVGLQSLHERKLLHGDLRPENVLFDSAGSANLCDYSLRVPFDLLTQEQRVYVAPEARNRRPQRASDIFAFGKLAQRLLGSYLWDNRKLPNGLDTDAFEWVLDYCTLNAPAERPSAHRLNSILFGDDANALVMQAVRAMREGQRIALDRLREQVSFASDDVEIAVGVAVAEMAGHIGVHQETLVAVLTPKRVARLIERLAIDYLPTGLHNQPLKGRPVTAADSELESLQDPKKSIDMEWRDRLHRLHFGFGIALDHDERMPHIRPGSKLEKRRDEYWQHIADMEDARRNLLSKDIYIYTAGVAELLTRTGTPVTDAEVAVLRRWGHLLAVPDHGRWLYPMFQFDPLDASVSPLIEESNERLKDADPWEVLSWWHLPRLSLERRSLAQVLHTEAGPPAVEAALQRIRPETE